MLRADVVVLGAGVVGLACARALAQTGREVYVLDREGGVGRGTSGRNSGVIHAGLYYPGDSWKARLCVDGAQALYRFCAEAGVPHERTGKWVLAAHPEELEALHAVARAATKNGADVTSVDGRDVTREDPALRACAALWSPNSGVVDAAALVDALAREARAAGAELALGQRAVRLERGSGGWTLTVTTGNDGASDATEEIHADTVVNAAGHGAPELARLAGLDLAAWDARPAYYRGDYMSLATEAPRPRCPLVYPVPQTHGLGVHLTRDLGGRTRAGPDAYPIDTQDVRLNLLDDTAWAHKAQTFAAALGRYLPGITAEHLSPEYAGVRPKLLRSDGSSGDFLLLGPADLGAPGIVHLLGIESPGLTACLAIADWVATQLETRTTRS